MNTQEIDEVFSSQSPPLETDHDDPLRKVTDWIYNTVENMDWLAGKDEYFVAEGIPGDRRFIDHFNSVCRVRFNASFYGQYLGDKRWFVALVRMK
jgi:hypothetical protein